MPQLLRKGWPESRVRDRYLEHAQAAVAAGLEFRAFAAEARPEIEQLLNAGKNRQGCDGRVPTVGLPGAPHGGGA